MPWQMQKGGMTHRYTSNLEGAPTNHLFSANPLDGDVPQGIMSVSVEKDESAGDYKRVTDVSDDSG